MSPRNYFFQSAYPEISDEYHKELSSFVPNIWYTVGKVSGLDKFFTFTAPSWSEGPSNNPITDPAKGIQEDNKPS